MWKVSQTQEYQQANMVRCSWWSVVLSPPSLLLRLIADQTQGGQRATIFTFGINIRQLTKHGHQQTSIFNVEGV